MAGDTSRDQSNSLTNLAQSRGSRIERSHEQRKLSATYFTYENVRFRYLSPLLILLVNIVLAFAVVLACWYAFLHYSQGLAWELSAFSILVFLVVVGISLFLAGACPSTVS